MHTEEVKETHKEAKTISIKLPRLKLPSFQAAILILLIVVGVLQTVQLYGLNLQIASSQVNTSSSSSASAPSSTTESVTSSLPTMVGGC